MGFTEFYKAIPDKMEKRKLRKKIMEQCYVEPQTIYMWLRKNRVPFLAQKQISLIVGISQLELFPENKSDI